MSSLLPLERATMTPEVTGASSLALAQLVVSFIDLRRLIFYRQPAQSPSSTNGWQ